MHSVPAHTGADKPNPNMMNSDTSNPRFALIREAAIFQIKLLADGIRDAILIPVSLIAALIGLVRGGKGCDREYRRVIALGMRSERWINLFGHHRPLSRAHPAGSLDKMLERVEDVVTEQYNRGRSAAEARRAISKALEESGEDDAV